MCNEIDKYIMVNIDIEEASTNPDELLVTFCVLSSLLSAPVVVVTRLGTEDELSTAVVINSVLTASVFVALVVLVSVVIISIVMASVVVASVVVASVVAASVISQLVTASAMIVIFFHNIPYIQDFLF